MMPPGRGERFGRVPAGVMYCRVAKAGLSSGALAGGDGRVPARGRRENGRLEAR